MPYIGVCWTDDHRFYAKTLTKIIYEIRKYGEGHGYGAEEFFKAKVSRRVYANLIADRDNPLSWIMRQGNALDEMSPGRKELLALMVRNIPKPKGRGHRTPEYRVAMRKGFRMNPPRDLVGNRIKTIFAELASRPALALALGEAGGGLRREYSPRQLGESVMATTQEVVSETPNWDTMPALAKNNLARQHREFGIQTHNLPIAKAQKEIALMTFVEDKKLLRKKIKAVDTILGNCTAATPKTEYVRLHREKNDLLSQLEEANDAYSIARDECEHTKTVTMLETTLKASAWKRSAQVIEILGPLQQEEITDDMQTELTEYAAHVLYQKALRKKLWL